MQTLAKKGKKEEMEKRDGEIHTQGARGREREREREREKRGMHAPEIEETR